jgi:outer membrane biosynthesis protein TonB
LSRRKTRQVLLAALVASAGVHLAFSLWPVELATEPETVRLQATITELPPPPVAAPVAAAPKPKPKSKRAVPPPAPVPAPEPETTLARRRGGPKRSGRPRRCRARHEAVAARGESRRFPVTPDPPPDAAARVDLAYTVFLGTQGFMIGDATTASGTAAIRTGWKPSARRAASRRCWSGAWAASRAAA